MVYVARPELIERSCVEYPNISLKGTSDSINDRYLFERFGS